MVAPDLRLSSLLEEDASSFMFLLPALWNCMDYALLDVLDYVIKIVFNFLFNPLHKVVELPHSPGGLAQWPQLWVDIHQTEVPFPSIYHPRIVRGRLPVARVYRGPDTQSRDPSKESKQGSMMEMDELPGRQSNWDKDCQTTSGSLNRESKRTSIIEQYVKIPLFDSIPKVCSQPYSSQHISSSDLCQQFPFQVMTNASINSGLALTPWGNGLPCLGTHYILAVDLHCIPRPPEIYGNHAVVGIALMAMLLDEASWGGEAMEQTFLFSSIYLDNADRLLSEFDFGNNTLPRVNRHP
eukprot:Gb_34705 [translate_table: standard]